MRFVCNRCIVQDRFLDMKRKMVLHERNAVDAERRHGLMQLSKKQLELGLAKVNSQGSIFRFFPGFLSVFYF